MPPAHLLMDGEEPMVCFGAVSHCGNKQHYSWITTYGRIYNGTDYTGKPIFRGEPRPDFDIKHADMLYILANRLSENMWETPRDNYSYPDNPDDTDLLLDIIARLTPTANKQN